MKDLTKELDQKEGWMARTDGGSRSCWRRTVRKHGYHAKMVGMAGAHEEER